MFVPNEDECGVVVGVRVAYAYDAMRAMRDVAVNYRGRGPAQTTNPPGVLDNLSRFVQEFADVDMDMDGKTYATDVKDARVELVPNDGRPASTLLWMPV